ncbi:hypothetical protein Prudu_013805 [Prunus dulcis]|uniref:Uncharacterized protein n=1 Tax=Prunus dulcis TaxID=3755 RepID=A0A4Y1RGM8_PRUDU|nr:hypothetical protein Prudu_013805 [Prunus dulcis]
MSGVSNGKAVDLLEFRTCVGGRRFLFERCATNPAVLLVFVSQICGREISHPFYSLRLRLPSFLLANFCILCLHGLSQEKGDFATSPKHFRLAIALADVVGQSQCMCTEVTNFVKYFGSGFFVLKKFTIKFHQYQVVGRKLPTASDEHPEIF